MSSNEEEFVEVWQHNLETEFSRIRKAIVAYPCVAMDTEFPGVVARPIGEFRTTNEYQYQLLRCNVNMLKLIQLGITLYDNEGQRKSGTSIWQFNFKFSLVEDMYAQDSIDMLTQAGIRFKRHEEDGIDPQQFAELIISSGLILCDEITWITFGSGYDFGYLLKLLTANELPAHDEGYFELLNLYFPQVYDVKVIMKSCSNLRGGLQEVADSLELERKGAQHQAGSDSLLTGGAFFKIKKAFFDGYIDKEKFNGHLFGLGSETSNGYSINNQNNNNATSDTS